MKWFKEKYNKKIIKNPDIKDISLEIPAIFEYFDIIRLPEYFKQTGIDSLPVIDSKNKIVGIVSESDLIKILPDIDLENYNYENNINISDIMTKDIWIETEYTDFENLLSKIQKLNAKILPVVNDKGEYTGRSIIRNLLIDDILKTVKPVSLGGLATPLGVYLTDGQHQAGSKNPGLILAGMTLGIISIFVEIIVNIISNHIEIHYIFIIFIQLVLFILILRVTPLVRYHAAEHQTIHAIEKGLPLNAEYIKIQPRAHKRCGTNIMVLIVGIQFVFLLSFESSIFNKPNLRFLFLIAGLLFVFSSWKKIGMWIQEYLTTAKASDRQIKSGIKAGKELLYLYKRDINNYSPNFFQKIWNMGLIQILLSFLFILWIFDIIIYMIKY
ncbi:MAG: DUF1385 domain-containing protein [bacterium]